MTYARITTDPPLPDAPSLKEAQPVRSITVEEEVCFNLRPENYKRILQLVNQHFYGAPRIPLDVECSEEHQLAAARVIAGRMVVLRVTYNEEGEVIKVEAKQP